MALRIHNTMGGEKQDFEPREPGRVGLYVCGVTVYDSCHVGHGRALVAFDVIARCLEMFGYELNYVRNITDIDDKIIERSRHLGCSWRDLTKRCSAQMREQCRQLGLREPDHEPLATSHIDDIIALIERLLNAGCAYRADNGDVYYSVASFADYGKLSGRDLSEQRAGVRVEVDAAKHDGADFALWKSAVAEVGWDSPWGRGRPGWHIECSAMAMRYLGESFDIHGGGADLIFPHHENEIAQSEAATCRPYAKYWLHAGAVRVDSEKMSKSVGNFVTLEEAIGDSPETLRYYLLSSHYRSPVEYDAQSLPQAKAALRRFYQALRAAPDQAALALDREEPGVARFFESLEDDFNAPAALAAMHDMARELNRCAESDKRRLAGLLRGMGAALNILGDDAEDFLRGAERVDDAEIEALVLERRRLRDAGDYDGADRIRNQLEAQGVILEDGGERTLWRRD